MKPHPLTPPPHDPDEAEIQRQAYHLWIDGGRLEGVELDNWFAAKELLRHRHGHARRPAGPIPRYVSSHKRRVLV